MSEEYLEGTRGSWWQLISVLSSREIPLELVPCPSSSSLLSQVFVAPLASRGIHSYTCSPLICMTSLDWIRRHEACDYSRVTGDECAIITHRSHRRQSDQVYLLRLSRVTSLISFNLAVAMRFQRLAKPLVCTKASFLVEYQWRITNSCIDSWARPLASLPISVPIPSSHSLFLFLCLDCYRRTIFLLLVT